MVSPRAYVHEGLRVHVPDVVPKPKKSIDRQSVVCVCMHSSTMQMCSRGTCAIAFFGFGCSFVRCCCVEDRQSLDATAVPSRVRPPVFRLHENGDSETKHYRNSTSSVLRNRHRAKAAP